jgi:hypothetical protein
MAMTAPPKHDAALPPAYDGEGIWYRCGDCGGAHEVDQPADFRSQMSDACASVSESSAALYAEFGIGSLGSRWDLLQDGGAMIFTRADGRRSFATCGVIASWRAETHDWLWSWAHPDDWHGPDLRQVGRQALDAGLDEGWDALTTARLFVNSDEAWHLTQLAARLSGMPMVYRAQVSDMNHWYFALARPVWMS